MGVYDNPPYYLSAYSLAVKRGFVGSIDEWLASLKGNKVELRCQDNKIQWRWRSNTELDKSAIDDTWKELLDVSEVKNAVENAETAKRDAETAKEAAENAAKHAEEEITHARYFNIDEHGAVSLQPEYRGAYPQNATADGMEFGVSDRGTGVTGSKNAELPRNLVIPDTVDGIAVTSIGVGSFAGNMTIESIVLPTEVTVIPDYCFFYCRNLKDVHANGIITSIGNYAMHSTAIDTVDFSGVTSVGLSAFAKSHVRKVALSALTEMGSQAFANCAYLQSVDVGQLTDVADLAFCGCYELQEVKSAAGITSVGMLAFCTTPKLSTVDLSAEADSIKEYAFLKSGFEYDWSALAGCAFGIGATAKLVNPEDIWSDLSIKECENPIPTLLRQGYDGWADRPIGTSGKTYGANGCALFSFIHAYCGLTGQQLNSVEEFENIAASFNADILDQFDNSTTFVPVIGEAFGLTVEDYRIETGEDLQRIYDALAEGKYVVAVMPDQNVVDLIDDDTGDEYDLLNGHAALIYGVRADGRLLIAESSWQDQENSANGIQFALRFEHILHTPIVVDGVEVKQGTKYYIVSKEDTTMKEVNEKLDALVLSASFRMQTGTYTVATDITETTTISIPGTSGAKLLLFQADDTTYAAIKSIAEGDAMRGHDWTVGVLAQILSEFNFGGKTRCYIAYMDELTYNSKTYWQPADKTVLCANGDGGFSFSVFALKAGKYNWTAYYWDE